jgi:poly(A) polymerase
LDKACGVEECNGKRHKDIFAHSLKVLHNVAQVSDNLYLRWAALLHDVGKVEVKAFKDGNWTFENHAEVGAKMIDKIFKRLTFPLDERMQYIKTLIRLHMRPMQLCEDGVTDAAVRRLLFDAGDTIDDLLILCNADITSSHRDKVEKFQKNYEFLKKRMVELEESDRLRNFQPPVDGNEIMELFNLTPGKIVGVLKEKVKDAILDGIIPNEHDAARAYVIEEFNELNK